MQKKYIIKLIFGLIVLIAGVVLAILSPNPGNTTIIFVNAGCIILILSLVLFLKKDKRISQDERTTKLSLYSYAYSWVFTMVLIGIISWLDQLKLYEFNVGNVLLIMLFGMSLSFIIINIYLNTKGDIS